MVSWRGVFGRRRRSGPEKAGYGQRPQPVPDGMDEMLAKTHGGLGTFDMDGTDVPLILFDTARFQDVMGWYQTSTDVGRGSSIKTDLNIMQDYVGHVFVETVLTFSNGEVLKVLINANQNLKFFKDLASSGVLALGQSNGGGEGFFMIQLPQLQKAQDALRMIEDGLAAGSGR